MLDDDCGRRLERLEGRMDGFEARLDGCQCEMRAELARQSQEVAVVRETHRIFEDLLGRAQEVQQTIARDVAAVRVALLEHMAQEGKDKTRMLVGIVTAAVSALGTLAVLGWGVYQVLERMP